MSDLMLYFIEEHKIHSAAFFKENDLQCLLPLLFSRKAVAERLLNCKDETKKKSLSNLLDWHNANIKTLLGL